MILFLDFDGVLHPEPCFDRTKLFCFLPNLESVLEEFPSVNIVITSTWRDNRSLDDLRVLFSEVIRHRVIGMTPNWRDCAELFEIIGFQRQTEIEAWLRNSLEPWESWIAIDDKPYLFRPFLPNLIKTESSIGFDAAAEIRLRMLLAGS